MSIANYYLSKKEKYSLDNEIELINSELSRGV